MASPDNSDDEGSGGGVAVEKAKPRLKEPSKFAVLLHNDDYSTMDFVIEVLQKFFRKTYEEAMKITLEVHHNGFGVAGIYSREIAETKVVQVGEHARAKGFPLRASVEEV